MPVKTQDVVKKTAAAVNASLLSPLRGADKGKYHLLTNARKRT